MIKTYIEGDKRKEKDIKFFICDRCHWCGVADEENYYYEEDYIYCHYYLKCPCCKGLAREMTDREIDELLKQIGKTKIGVYDLN